MSSFDKWFDEITDAVGGSKAEEQHEKCSTCQGSGLIEINKPIGGLRTGDIVPCPDCGLYCPQYSLPGIPVINYHCPACNDTGWTEWIDNSQPIGPISYPVICPNCTNWSGKPNPQP